MSVFIATANTTFRTLYIQLSSTIYFGLFWLSLTTYLGMFNVRCKIYTMKAKNFQNIADGNWIYLTLKVVFTLAIDRHNSKMKQSGIFLLSPSPTVSYNPLHETFLQNVRCWLVQHSVERGMACIRQNNHAQHCGLLRSACRLVNRYGLSKDLCVFIFRVKESKRCSVKISDLNKWPSYMWKGGGKFPFSVFSSSIPSQHNREPHGSAQRSLEKVAPRSCITDSPLLWTACLDFINFLHFNKLTRLVILY
jgi:hypothetical protein